MNPRGAADEAEMSPTRTLHRQASDAGFSLVELLAGAIAAVVVMGSVLAMTVRQSAQRQADAELQIAFCACANNLEELRVLPIEQVAAMDGVGFDAPGPDGSGSGLRLLPGDADGLPGTLSVAVDRSAGGRTLYRVRAAIEWLGTNGPRRCELETLIGPRS